MSSGGSSVDACKQCSSVLSPFMSMSEMQPPVPGPTLQLMDTGASQQSLSQPSFSQSQAFSVQQPSKPPVKGLPPGQAETMTDDRRMAVSEIAKVSLQFTSPRVSFPQSLVSPRV